MASIDTKQLDAFKKRIESQLKGDQQPFFEDCVREMAARLISKAVKRTPVGKGTFEVVTTEKGKTVTKRLTNGGTLRRGWTSKTEQDAQSGGNGNAQEFAKSMPVKKQGKNYNITVINPVSYASYVEYGHRQNVGQYVPVLGKRLVQSWVAGQYMLHKSADELNADAGEILQDKLERYIKGLMNGK